MQCHEALHNWERRSYVGKLSRHPKPVLFPNFLVGGFSCAQSGLAKGSHFHKEFIVIAPLVLEESCDDVGVESVVGNVIPHPLHSFRVRAGHGRFRTEWRSSWRLADGGTRTGRGQSMLWKTAKLRGPVTCEKSCRAHECSSRQTRFCWSWGTGQDKMSDPAPFLPRAAVCSLCWYCHCSHA